jgi:hypothetical protein
MIDKELVITTNTGNNELLVHFRKVLEIEHAKLCNPEKNGSDFESLLRSYIYRDLPVFEKQSAVSDTNKLKRLMESHLKIKNESP